MSLTNISNKGNKDFPKWSYGVIAGGLTGVAIAGVTIYHYVSKNVRQKRAENDVKEIDKETLRTPREESNKHPITAIF